MALPLILRAAGSLATSKGGKAIGGALAKGATKKAAKSIVNSMGTAGKVANKAQPTNDNKEKNAPVVVPHIEPLKHSFDDDNSVKSVLEVAVNYLSSISNTIQDQLNLDKQIARDEYLDSQEDKIEAISNPDTIEPDATKVDEEEKSGIGSLILTFIGLAAKFVVPIIATVTSIGAIVAGILGLSWSDDAKATDIGSSHPNFGNPSSGKFNIFNNGNSLGDAEPISNRNSGTGTGLFSNIKSVVREAESRNNPDAIHGPRGIPTTGKKQFNKSLTSMTIREVYNKTKSLAASDGAVGSSGAAGLYQIIPPTLNDLMTKKAQKGHHGLDWNDRFSVENQNKLADTLIAKKQRIKPTDSTDSIVKRLAVEWAGLPSTNGRSHHGGVQGNKANVSLSKVKAAISKDKSQSTPVRLSANARSNSTVNNFNSLAPMSSGVRGNKANQLTDNKIKSNVNMFAGLKPKPKPINMQTPKERLQSVNNGDLDIINPNYRVADSAVLSGYIKAFGGSGNLVA